MTAGVEGRPGGGARTRSPEAGVEGRRHLSGGAPHCRVPDCGGSAKLPALTGPRPGGRCPSWRRPLRRSPFRSMARPVTARRLRTREAATPAPAAAQKQARARPAPRSRPAPRRRAPARLMPPIDKTQLEMFVQDNISIGDSTPQQQSSPVTENVAFLLGLNPSENSSRRNQNYATEIP
ncbi:hypothetical protein QTO34_001603 [Cnephaeus nilssonii]|uniref:Uncharacterized protein n=1 Tax=Cnephaeus nilssonii TaxID=3371016 RepID=A0AA40HVZ9_CNENI|nr:hypothetical protein QTO34_001603 [Eptesicus nilssonii]